MGKPLSVLLPFLLSLLQACTHPELADGGQCRKGKGREGSAAGLSIRGQGLRGWLGSMPSKFQWEKAVEVSHPEEPWEGKGEVGPK